MYSSNVTRRCQTKATNKACAHIREDITVQIRHDHHAISKGAGVLADLETDAIQEVFVVLNLGKFLRDLATGG